MFLIIEFLKKIKNLMPVFFFELFNQEHKIWTWFNT
jgi:hypothetical protein